MNSIYDLSIKLSMSTVGMSAGANAAMRMFANIQHQAGLTGTQIDKLGKSLAMLGTGAVITGVGVGLLGFMDSAVKKAMQLQTVMIGIQTRTGASTAQMAALQTQAQNIGLTNQMSVGDVAGVAQSASRAGITNIGQLSQMLKPLTNYAEVMLRATGADPSHSATIGVELAHLYGAFGNKKIGGVSDTQYLVNQLGKAMQIVPGSQDQFLRLLSQFVGTERPLYKGKPPQALISDTISEATLLSQMGQGTRGGNQIARIITAMMGGARGKSAIDAIAGIQRGTGIQFANAQGQINDPSLLLKALATTAEKLNPQQTMTEFSRAFQQNGARLAGLFSDPTVGVRLQVIAQAMKAMPDLAAQQRRYNASVPGQFNQANKNFDSAMTQLGILWLPIAARAAMAWAAFTAGLVRFTQQHPALMQFMATFVAVTAAVALVVGPLMMLAGAVGAVLAVFGVAGLAPVIVAILAIGAAIAGLTWVILHWKDIMGFAAASFDALGAAVHRLMVVLGLAHDPAKVYARSTAPPVVPASIVRATAPTGGTVGLPNYLYVAPIPGANSKPVHQPVPIHGHGKGTGGGGAVWDMPVIQGRRSGSGATVLELHVHPGAVGPITVHGAAGHDEEALAVRVGAHVVRDLGDHLVHTLTSGAPSILGLSPTLGTPVAR